MKYVPQNKYQFLFLYYYYYYFVVVCEVTKFHFD